MKVNSIMYVLVAVIIVYIMQIFIAYPFTAIASALPLGFLSRKWSAIIGFVIGLVSSLSLYLIYPIEGLIKLSNILGEILGINGLVIVLLYPTVYGLILAISALFFSSIIEKK